MGYRKWPGWVQDMLKKKWVTWVLVLFILLLPIPAVVQYLQTFIVRNAVVTAYLYEVRAPIDGVVESLDSESGTIPGAGPTMVLRNRRVPRAGIEALEARNRENQKYHDFLGKELLILEARLNRNQGMFSGYGTMIQKDLDLSLAILKARQEGETARLKEADQIRKRTIPLVETSVVAQEEIDRIEADFSEAQALLKVTGLEQDQILHRRQMLKNNLFPSSLADGILQVESQMNTLEMKILDCKRRMHAVQADIAAGAMKLRVLGEDFEHRSAQADVVLPGTAVIWDVDVRTGMEVAKGDRLLSYIDRSRLLVEVVIDDATIALIHQGHAVQVRLFGGNRFITGTVIQVMGSAGDWPGNRFAAGVRARSVRDGRVLVQIEDTQLHGDVKRFCGVGRTAYARFEGIGLIEQYFGTFLR